MLVSAPLLCGGILGLSLLPAAQDLSGGPQDDPAPGRQDLAERVRTLEWQLEALQAGGDGARPAGGLDLSGDEVVSLGNVLADDVGARPWYENVSLSGHVAATYWDNGGVGVASEGSSMVKEASLFFDVTVWEGWSAFLEVQAVRFVHDYDTDFLTGEVYVHGRDLFAGEDGRGIGIKAGRFDVPFGEEYLWQDAPENPLINQSAAFPYGFDEGLLVHGTWREADWLLALMDGSYQRSMDDDSSKALAGKLGRHLGRGVHASASAMYSGDFRESAIKLSGQPLRPVGASGPSTAGASPSVEASALLWELDLGLEDLGRASGSLAVGGADIDDDVDAFDRDLLWFLVEPRVALCDDLDLVLRWSEIGTYDGDEGYHLDGKPFAFGRAFGDDVERLRRLSAGLVWAPNPHVLVKLEVGRDDVDLIDASPLDPMNGERTFAGIELVAFL